MGGSPPCSHSSVLFSWSCTQGWRRGPSRFQGAGLLYESQYEGPPSAAQGHVGSWPPHPCQHRKDGLGLRELRKAPHDRTQTVMSSGVTSPCTEGSPSLLLPGSGSEGASRDRFPGQGGACWVSSIQHVGEETNLKPCGLRPGGPSCAQDPAAARSEQSLPVAHYPST